MSKPDYYDALGLLGDSLPDFVEGFLDGVATDAQREALAAWLRDSDANVACFAQLAFLESAIGSILTSQQHAQDAQDGQMLDPQAHVSLADQLALLEPREPVALVDFTEESKRRGLKNRKAKAAADRRRMRLKQSQSSGEDSRGLVISKVAIWLGLAAALGLVIWLGRPDPQAPQANPEVASRDDSADRQTSVAPVYVAQVVDSINAQWVGTTSVDGRLELGKIVELRSGIAEIVFEDGAIVCIEAPATFALSGTDTLRLIEGRLSVEVLRRANRFEIVTPNMTLTASNTEFGVEVMGGRVIQSHVYQGIVRVKATSGASAGSRLDIREGEGVAIVDDELIQSQHTGDFLRRLDDVLFRVEITGDAEQIFAPPSSLAMDAYQRDNMLRVIVESRGVEIGVRASLSATLSMPGVAQNPFRSHDINLGGDRADSFLLHFDVQRHLEVGTEQTVEGAIIFPRPILAVQCGLAELVSGDRLFGAEGTFYEANDLARGIFGSREKGAGDWFVLSEDRMALRFHIQANNMDQCRVLIEAARPRDAEH